MRSALSVIVALGAGAAVVAAPVPKVRVRPADELLAEVSLPPAGLFDPDRDKVSRPELGQTSLEHYASAAQGQPALRQAVAQAHLLLWATSPAPAPRPLQARVAALRKQLALGPVPLRQSAPAPGAEARFQAGLMTASRNLARAVARLEDAAEKLTEVQHDARLECPRWHAHHALVLAWLHVRLAAVEEQALALGTMRKEPPPLDTRRYKGWRLSPSEKLRDPVTKAHQKEAARLFAQIEREHPGTAWAAMAQQGRGALLGVEWTPFE